MKKDKQAKNFSTHEHQPSFECSIEDEECWKILESKKNKIKLYVLGSIHFSECINDWTDNTLVAILDDVYEVGNN